MQLIKTTQELKDICKTFKKCKYFTLDTEFIRDKTYYPRLCLVQIATPEKEAYAIDTLSEELDITPLMKLIDNKRILKVLHSARQDIEIFFHINGKVPQAIFDTQVAAMVCGYGDSVSYAKLAKQIAGVTIDKASRYTDWALRPLSKKQIDYALSDVIHLVDIYEAIAKKLESTNRTKWIKEEMGNLLDKSIYNIKPEDSWKKLNTRSTNSSYLNILQALAKWRELQAQKDDLPRAHVLKDKQLLEIAANAPQNRQEFKRIRGMGRLLGEKKYMDAIIETIENAKKTPKRKWPSVPKTHTFNAKPPLVELLKVLLKHKCEETGVAERMIATSDDLVALVEQKRPRIPLLKGWRYEVFGKEALALKEGKIWLTGQGKDVHIIKNEKK